MLELHTAPQLMDGLSAGYTVVHPEGKGKRNVCTCQYAIWHYWVHTGLGYHCIVCIGTCAWNWSYVLGYV